MPRRITRSFTIPITPSLLRKALLWAGQYDHVHLFNGTEVASYPFGAFPTRLAAGCIREFCVDQSGYDTFGQLQALHQQTNDWLVGYLGYDLKNEIEKLSSHNPDRLGFPLAHFYQPLHLINFLEGEMRIHSIDEPTAIFEQILQTADPLDSPIMASEKPEKITVRARVNRETYLSNVETIRRHIIEGDVYELNYCMEFFAEEALLDPADLYWRLHQLSPTPFSVFQRIGSRYLLCASPERFLKKTGNQLISQPIKGTIRRGENPEEDRRLRERLRNDEKELAENMMIVDLVRNDLARSARTGTVKVEEMFGIYSFRQVHQMISTVSAEMRENLPFTQAIRNAFPMGSMTGAPKIRAMELIERYEESRRGLFSGAVGYITPTGDFDFNVVIRSILYEAQSRYLSFHVGSAITYDSVPEQEYEECLLKAQAMLQLLEG
jgi:para-aminobenzoate synthetase component 1